MKLQSVLQLLDKIAQMHNLSRPYLVGGIPRSIVQGRIADLHDVDITTGAKDVAQLADLLAAALGVEVKSLKDGHKNISYNGMSLDFSTNMTYPNIDELLPATVTNKNDLLRETYSRDFTVNTLLVPLDFSEVIDLTGHGVADIKNGIIRCPVDCDVSFKQSPARILRALYYAAKYNMELLPDIKKAIKDNVGLIKSLSRHYSAEKINDIIRLKPEMLNDLIELGVLHQVPMTKELSKALINSRKLLDVI